MEINFGVCVVCSKMMNYEEYCLGLGRCKGCGRKCEEEVGFNTIYGNIIIKKEEKTYGFIDNSSW